jgi:aromatic ring-opening dioxygenase catalytic subunit (LigB family)
MSAKMPTLYIPHGGGPCFFMEWNPRNAWDSMEAYLRGLAATLPERPKAILLISAHWLENGFIVGTNPRPDLIYDYYGFPPHTYELKYPAKGDPALAARVRDLLAKAGLPQGADPQRGYDHGMFIPFLLVFPDAEIPVVQLSLKADMDPALHIAAGEALAPLRDEGVLIVGSGMSFHNMAAFMGRVHIPNLQQHAIVFDDWLKTTLTEKTGAERNDALAQWDGAPYAREAHPVQGEEHLLPLMVAAGAGGADAGAQNYHDFVMGSPLSGYRFG